MPPIRGSSSEDTLLSELGAKITTAFRRARPDHYNGETHPGDWLHHIESLCSSCGITRGAWSRLVVIQLKGPFLYRERRAELTYAQGRRFFTRAAGWAPVHGESMQEYKRRFEEDLLVECPYELRQEDACELFWKGVPHEIRALVYFPRPYPDYDHLCSEVIYAEMHLKADRVNTPPTRELENVEDASSHIEASAPHQPEAVGDDDAHIGSEEEDPTEVFSEGEDDETDGP
ncbi:hypothetical protein TIFTF001_047692 [Ficus carica]|uniref:Uncharacterized protein n=1 Tax=Ficus carica TaxID=3494 RepID=A0AA87ZIM2_FICCA|nr:hypothetical protein TIFTF001_047683 [Ficus carica]GMN24964.1 hypothetical protein TIFTF001_047686 [Ficus carica]GMN24998.1 hypothetical protein TIFTF001_047689 [Ficus carica]GMN25011.1 hypothetical protein TIFTF001_047692 [Ficus carica]